MANTITGNKDGENGHNDTYRIPGCGSEISREQVVQETKEGKYPNFGVYTRDGEKYVRALPDSRSSNNVDPDRN